MRCLNIAHRGFSGIYPENTMLAFQKAVEVKCDGIETDVQLTKDGAAVIFHDEILNRTTNGKGFIEDHTYAELSKLDAGIKKGREFSGCKIPSLDEFLDYVKDKNILINLELKNSIINYPDLEQKVINKIYEYKLQNNCVISSFNHYSMVECKKIDYKIKTGLLYEGMLYHPEKYIEYVGADALHPNFVAMHSKDVVKCIKEKNIAINVYTVNHENYMIDMINLGVDGIITNYPDKLKNVILNLNS